MASSPIALILGAGPNVGHHVAQAFFTQGYKVALASRKANEAERTPTQVNIACDLSDIASVPGVFEKVKAALGTPSVVVYNGIFPFLSFPSLPYPPCEKILRLCHTSRLRPPKAAAVTPNDPKNPLELPVSDFIHDLRINTASAYVAAQQATLAFAQLPDTASKTFIYTGNILNTTIMVPLMDLGVGKAATASWLRCAAEAYGEQGSKYVFFHVVGFMSDEVEDY